MIPIKFKEITGKELEKYAETEHETVNFIDDLMSVVSTNSP